MSIQNSFTKNPMQEHLYHTIIYFLLKTRTKAVWIVLELSKYFLNEKNLYKYILQCQICKLLDNYYITRAYIVDDAYQLTTPKYNR